MRLSLRLAAATMALGPCLVVPTFGLQSGIGLSYRADVDMVVLQVSVTGPRGARAPDLQPADFTVLENGQPQSLSFFSSQPTPVALSLLLDTSASMKPMLKLARDGARELAQSLGPHDLAQVVTFDNRVRILQPFTHLMDDVESALGRTSTEGATSLYTAVYIALNELRALRSSTRGIRRHAIVLLSDGEDTVSVIDFDQVMELARRLDVAIYAIGLQPPPETRAAIARAADSRFVLRQLAQATGGRVFFAERPDDLLGLYRRIAEEIANQYTLAYVAAKPGPDRQWRNVAVRVGRPGHVALTRPGYFPGI